MLIFQFNDIIDKDEIKPKFFKLWCDYICNMVNSEENNALLLPPFIDFICNTDNNIPTDNYTIELNNDESLT